MIPFAPITNLMKNYNIVALTKLNSLTSGNANSEAVKEELISPPVRQLMAFVTKRHGASCSQQAFEVKQKAENEGLLMQVLFQTHKIKIPET